MDLRDVLNVASKDDIDPSRPLTIGNRTFGPEATVEAIKILDGGNSLSAAKAISKSISQPLYWEILRTGNPVGEIFGLPVDINNSLPTAVELATLRAVALLDPEEANAALEGRALICLSLTDDLGKISRILSALEPQGPRTSILFNKYRRINLSDPADKHLTETVLKCIEGSFTTYPLKFRFLELYRAIESRFLSEVKRTLLSEFDRRPLEALEDATKQLKSELNQLTKLASTTDVFFEMIWHALYSIKKENRFSAALFHKLSASEHKSPEWKAGAALLYYIRCAIVHAGSKDIIFEAFLDGDTALEAIFESVEEASLALAGISLA